VIASRSYPNGWVLYAGSNNTWQFWVNNGTGMLAISGGAVTLNAWTHLVGTFSGTTAQLYVNGVLAGTGTVTSYQPQTTKPLVIGQGEPGSGFFFPGVIDELVDAALAANVPFRAIVADCLYGENPTFEGALCEAGLPFVLGLRPSKGVWAPIGAAHTPKEAAQALAWTNPAEPGDWTKVERTLRDGHTETWWAADLRFGSYGPSKTLRIIVATTDPATLPDLTTWYLSTNLPHSDAPRTTDSLLPPADLAEIVRLYGLRNWVEQGYRQVKQELGWADFMVRSDRAIRRHWELVCCAFAFCWRDWFHPSTPPDHLSGDRLPAPIKPSTDLAETTAGRGKNQHQSRRPLGSTLVAPRLAPRPGLAQSLDVPAALLARLVRSAPTLRTPSARQLGR